LNLKDEKFSIDFYQNKYQLTPKKGRDLFSILFLINPDNFKVDRQKIQQKEDNKSLTINYSNYTKVDDEVFPKGIHIAASDTKNTSTIDINYRSVAFNNHVNFPFKIPSNYKQVVLKN
jgi:hypothetical protein